MTIRNLEARLTRLENTLNRTPAFVIVWRIVEADGSNAEPARFETEDGAHAWTRRHGENADDFENRVRGEAACLGKAVLLLLSDCRDL